MAEEFRHETQRVRPYGGKFGAYARPERVRVRQHECRSPLCIECGSDGRPRIVARPMTEAEREEREQSATWPDWANE